MLTDGEGSQPRFDACLRLLLLSLEYNFVTSAPYPCLLLLNIRSMHPSNNTQQTYHEYTLTSQTTNLFYNYKFFSQQSPSFLTELISNAVTTRERSRGGGELSQHSTYTRCGYNVEFPGAWVEGLNESLVPPQGRHARCIK